MSRDYFPPPLLPLLTHQSSSAIDSNLISNVFFHFQLVDYLTGDFLEEQYTGQRDLAGKVSTLDRMMKGQGELAEFLYDKQLLV